MMPAGLQRHSRGSVTLCWLCWLSVGCALGASASGALLVGFLAGLLAPCWLCWLCWLCFGRIGLGHLWCCSSADHRLGLCEGMSGSTSYLRTTAIARYPSTGHRLARLEGCFENFCCFSAHRPRGTPPGWTRQLFRRPPMSLGSQASGGLTSLHTHSGRPPPRPAPLAMSLTLNAAGSTQFSMSLAGCCFGAAPRLAAKCPCPSYRDKDWHSR